MGVTGGGWLAACRATAIAGAVLWAAGGVAGSLDLVEPVALLRAGGVALALAGWGAEVVLSGLAAPMVAGLLLLPAIVAGGAVAWGWAGGPAGGDAPAGAQAAAMVALCAPFLTAALRSLLLEATSTWHVGVAGAALAVGGGVATVVQGDFAPGPEAVGLLTVAGVLLVAYAASDRQSLAELAGSRQLRWGGGSILLQVLVGAIAVGTYAVARRNDHTWDWTRTGTYSLADQTVRVVEGLGFDVEVVAFYREANPSREEFRDLVGRIAERSDRITVRWVDPLANPLEAKEALVTGDHGVVLLKGRGKQRRLEGEIREDEVVRELVVLGSDKDHEICWVQGHGEPDPDDDQAEDGFGGVRSELEGLNYRVRPVFTTKEQVPSSCEVLVVARPEADWLPFEREGLAAYVAGGGRAFVLVDLYSRRGQIFDVPGLVADLARYGVQVGDDVVFDVNQKHRMLGSEDPTMVVLSGVDLAPHPVTRGLSALVLAGARSVRFRAAEGLAGDELLHTSPEAWAETTPEAPGPDEGTEAIGLVPLMVAVEVQDPAALRVAAPAGSPPEPPDGESPSTPAGGGRPTAPAASPEPGAGVPADFAPKAGGRLVVLGDTDFPSNRYLDLGNNRDLFLDVIAWLAEEPDQLGERPASGEPLAITESDEALLCLGSVVVLPATALLVALGVLIRRRSM